VSILEAIVLAVIQGLTEFLPISSSGHLVLARWLFGWDDPGLDFDVAVHIGTLVAILWAFRREVWTTLRGLPGGDANVEGLKPRRLVWLGLIGTVPIVIVGAFLYEELEGQLRGATSAAALLLATGVLIAGAEWRARNSVSQSPLAGLTERHSLLVGILQCLAVLPGISRSGICMVGAMALGYSREAAARWAFWLSIPALAGAGVLTIRALLTESEPIEATTLLVGTLVAFATALVAIRTLLWLVRGRTLAPFAAYCLIAGLAALIARAAGA
jgi:undecaprenyl-diphosphatase